jgi:light-regulated signal transduction histidine kinase (bacteriophytochrome)
MNILIIDDSQGDHDIEMEYLDEGNGNYQFYHAYNAAEGIELYRKHAIDCVLLDYRMPDKDGLEVLKQLTEGNKFVPVIMLTADGNEFVAVSAMKLGSQDYIPKNMLTAAALKRTVEKAVERSEMIKRMEIYKAQLEQSNRELEQFAHIVAHDLKAPLRAVTQHLTLIENKNASLLDEKSKYSLEFAIKGTSRMRTLIDALFEYARLGFSEPQFERVSLKFLLEQIQKDLSAVIDERKAIITHDVLPEVKGDVILLAQLLQNLIGNAIKYCKETPRIHISARQEDKKWRIGVRDNGIGIPKEQHQQIFAIFRRLHAEEEYPGIGLGLAICDRIAKQHGGNIEVESEPGEGSCFTFTLPAVETTVSSQEKMRAYG